LHFDVNQGAFNKKIAIFFVNHPVVLYCNMRILRRKLRCDTAYFKPCTFTGAMTFVSAA
jgi:hypothetical protein